MAEEERERDEQVQAGHFAALLRRKASELLEAGHRNVISRRRSATPYAAPYGAFCISIKLVSSTHSSLQCFTGYVVGSGEDCRAALLVL